MARLQGIPDGRLKIPGAVTERRYGGMLGNSFTVSVVGRIALRLLRTIGIAGPEVRDPWAEAGGRAPPDGGRSGGGKRRREVREDIDNDIVRLQRTRRHAN